MINTTNEGEKPIPSYYKQKELYSNYVVNLWITNEKTKELWIVWKKKKRYFKIALTLKYIGRLECNIQEKIIRTLLIVSKKYDFDDSFRGPIPEVVQYRADPRQRWSKLLALRHDQKISLISLTPHGGRIRY